MSNTPEQSRQQDWDAFDAKNRAKVASYIHEEQTPEMGGATQLGIAQQAGRYLNSYEMLRQTALVLERRAAGLREFADMLQSLSMVRGISESQNVAALIRSVCESHKVNS